MLLSAGSAYVFAADDERVPVEVTPQLVVHLLAVVAVHVLDVVRSADAAGDVDQRVRADTAVQVFVATVEPAGNNTG